MRVVGCFNPGAAVRDGEVILLVRVAEEVIERRDGLLPSPRIDSHGRLVVDWLAADHYDLGDPRVYARRKDGRLRLRFISHLRVVRCGSGRTADPRAGGGVILPEGPYEEYGIEDPRITRIGATYYITYVAASRHGVVTCLMSTSDFESFQRHGIIFCPDNKDVVFFPEKVAGRFLALHRPMPAMKFSTPHIWLARSPDLRDWGAHEQLTSEALASDDGHSDRIGGGTPPIRTDHGWLTIYHGAEKSPQDPGVGVYTAGALLLDGQHPERIVAHLNPIMVPTEPYEPRGFVDNVVFPTAVVEEDDHYLVYYGAADENVGLTAFAKDDLLAALTDQGGANR